MSSTGPKSPKRPGTTLSNFFLALLPPTTKKALSRDGMKRHNSYDSLSDGIRNFSHKSESTTSSSYCTVALSGSTSPKRISEPGNSIRLLDDSQLFPEKVVKILSVLNKSNKIIVFFEEMPHLSTSTRHSDIKLTKYSKYFEEYISVKPQRKKNLDTVKIVLTPVIRRRDMKGEPGFSHVALATLVKHGIIKTIVTSSTTNQFRMVGVPEEALMEVYGNKFREICELCPNSKYLDDTRTQETFTGRRCEQCNGRMKMDVVGLGEDVSPRTFDKLLHHLSGSDASLVLDSSLLDIPFADLPLHATRNLLVCTPFELPKKYREYLNVNQLCSYSEDLLISLLDHFQIKL